LGIRQKAAVLQRKPRSFNEYLMPKNHTMTDEAIPWQSGVYLGIAANFSFQ
jgi:hypothetical protein